MGKNSRKQAKAPTQDAAPVSRPDYRISPITLAAASVNPNRAHTPQQFAVPKAPPGVVPDGAPPMALDYGIQNALTYMNEGALFGGNTGWLGFPALSELAQVPEVRRIAEIIAKEMTRKFVRITSNGDGDKTDKIKAIEDAFDRFKVRDVFRDMAMMDSLLGRAHLYIDTGYSNNPDELATALMMSPKKIKKGGLKAFRPIEATWAWPAAYNSSSPLEPHFYQPQSWFVMGKTVHISRLLLFVGKPVPTLLRAAYSFGGLSMTQMALPYVQAWQKTRDSVVDLIHSFSVPVLKTNMSATLAGTGGEDMILRAQLFNQTRDNRGLFMLDNETEEFINVSTPLSTLDHLQAQAQEHIAAVSGIPVSLLNGTTPSGLNASSEGEIRIFYAYISAQQEMFFKTHLETVLKVIQLNEFGSIDDSIGFKFEELWQMNETEQAVVRKTDVDTAVELIAAGVLSPEEERKRVATSEDSLYQGLDVSDVPDPPEDEEDPSLTPDPAKPGGEKIGSRS